MSELALLRMIDIRKKLRELEELRKDIICVCSGPLVGNLNRKLLDVIEATQADLNQQLENLSLRRKSYDS